MKNIYKIKIDTTYNRVVSFLYLRIIVCYLTIAVVSGGIVSCNYLSIDKYFTDELNIDSVFLSKRYIEAYMWEAASMFPNETHFLANNYTPGPFACDEGFSLANTIDHVGLGYILGEISAERMLTLRNAYSTYYQIIRKCNTIITRIDEAVDMTTVDRFNILGNTRFIRAYAYYRLLLDFGPPIILDNELPNSNEDLSYYDRPRSTYDEAIEYICGELEEVANWLPETVSIMEFGRPTKGAAWGLIAKTRLFQASPLFNGGDAARSCFGDWRRSADNTHYVSQIYEERRWAVAAAAAKRLIDTGKYRLHTVEASDKTPPLPENIISDPDYYNDWEDGGAAGIDHFHSYSDMFTGEAVIAANPEYVWARTATFGNMNLNLAFPISNGGYNAMGVTQKIIDAYLMVDGRTIFNSSLEYPYSESGFTTSAKSFSGYQLNAGVYNMYNNREMRFYASIGFSGRFWAMSSATDVGSYNQTITYYYDSPNGRTADETGRRVPPTGYVCTKFIHPTDALQGTNRRTMGKSYAMIRYADILLCYAEALNNLTENHEVEIGGKNYTLSRDIEEIRLAFNQVRHRAGLPGLTYAELADASKIQELIERERMVEFLYENYRYFDVRRWGIYEESEGEPIMGMNIDSNNEGFYRRSIPSTSRIMQRIVAKRMVFLPIPLDEVRRLSSLDQNPGWEK